MQVVAAVGFAFAIMIGALSSSSRAADPAKQDSPTLKNLLAADEGESNAQARYTAFAQTADAEGYAGAASLFRAAARAEGIHAAAHAAVIRKMGGVPVAVIQTPEPKRTSENLQTAIDGESYERDTMYPEFLKQARAEGNKDAMQSFVYAKTAEAEHAKLYKEALDALDSWKSVRDFYVCATCGYTTSAFDFAKCISCFSPKDDYVKVS
jgi:rubrerythrin